MLYKEKVSFRRVSIVCFLCFLPLIAGKLPRFINASKHLPNYKEQNLGRIGTMAAVRM